MTADPVRIVYFGTPQVAVAPLRALVIAGHQVELVVTRPPRRRGRGGRSTPSPVGSVASELGLKVTWNADDATAVSADLGVVVAFGELISDEVLRQRRTVNLHFSLLPRWRGAAPVERAILAGDTETGVCLMEVVSELDAGGVYRRAHTPINSGDTADDLRARLCAMGVDLLLDALANGFDTPEPQTGTVTWAEKISPPELRIDWAAPAEQILRLVRVGGAWTTLRGRRLKVLSAAPAPAWAHPTTGSNTDLHRDAAVSHDVAAAGTLTVARGNKGSDAVLVATGDAGVELLTVQAEGRQPTAAAQWSLGARLTATDRLGM